MLMKDGQDLFFWVARVATPFQTALFLSFCHTYRGDVVESPKTLSAHNFVSVKMLVKHLSKRKNLNQGGCKVNTSNLCINFKAVPKQNVHSVINWINEKVRRNK